jgi:galactokinase
LRDGSIDPAGEWLREGQDSLRYDYEVSCPEIDEIIEVLSGNIDVLGARMIGGGFGGMVLALVHEADEDDIAGLLEGTYNQGHPKPARVFEVTPANGAECRMT